jgi:amidase
LNLTAGGSSGGEGAILALRAAPLGVGTDIAGSIRIPAMCCGTFGFKPTTNRIPYGRCTISGRQGSPGIMPVAGPLANSARDIRYFMEHVIDAKPWNIDSSAKVAPWRATEQKSKLKIGFILEHPNAKVTPPIRRALGQAASKLEKAGHLVVALDDYPSFKEVNTLAWSYLGLDPKRTSMQYIADSGEPPVASVAGVYEWFLKTNPADAGKTMEDLFQMNTKKAQYHTKWHKLFRDGELDVLLLPGYVNTAPPHDTYGFPAYTVIWNLLDVSDFDATTFRRGN